MAEEIQKRSKERYYRGVSIEDLKKLDIREFAKLIKSRPRRAILRNYDLVEKFIRKCEENTKNNKPIRTHSRDIVIVPAMVRLNIGIHNGKEFSRVEITWEMLGHRLGEFAMTRKSVKHGAAGIGATKSSASKSVK